MVEVLEDIPLDIKPEEIIRSLRLRKPNPQIAEMVNELVKASAPLARPKALYKISYVEKRDGDILEIDGVKFSSRVLRINLNDLNRVFPYVTTCGRELDGIQISEGDLLKSFCLEAIKMSALRAAIAYLAEYLQKKYALPKIARMNPGSLEDWPITEQGPLFSLLGDVEKSIGVTLKPSNLMQPLKSTSGIYFATEVTFESCQLCPREVCSGRRAAYSTEMAEKYRKL